MARSMGEPDSLVEDPGPAWGFLVEIEPHSCVLQLREGSLVRNQVYLLEGGGLTFLAGKVMWIRAAQTGLFFKQAIHPDSLDLLRAHIAGSARYAPARRITLRSME